MLEVDEDSRLGLEILRNGSRYGANLVPSDDESAAFYEMAVEQLAGAGLRRYEISNFAQPGFESVHNLKYWLRMPYVGFGADAHSFDGTMRWSNLESPAEYVERPGRTPLSPVNAQEERFFVGLRMMDGIEPMPEDWRRYETAISQFVSDGLLAREGNRLRLTDRGVLLSNEVFQEFLAT
jgi:oxygen-independent coproporphyrinogen-3 oxidase